MQENIDDNEVIERVLNGDIEAYRILVDAHNPLVIAFFASRLFNKDLVYDMAQETFITAFRSLGKFAHESQFSTWLLGIARLKLLEHLRNSTQKRDRHEAMRAELMIRITSQPNDRQKARSADHMARLRDCVERLAPHVREVVSRRYFENESVKAISKTLNRSTDAVRALLTRARQSLKLCMTGALQ